MRVRLGLFFRLIKPVWSLWMELNTYSLHNYHSLGLSFPPGSVRPRFVSNRYLLPPFFPPHSSPLLLGGRVLLAPRLLLPPGLRGTSAVAGRDPPGAVERVGSAGCTRFCLPSRPCTTPLSRPSRHLSATNRLWS